jgi:hypothetical protein
LTSLLVATDWPSGGEPVAYASSDVAQGFLPVVFTGSEPDELDLDEDAVGSDNLIASYVDDPRPGQDGSAMAVFDGAAAVIVTFGDGEPDYNEMVAHLDHFYVSIDNDFDLQLLFVSDGTQAGTVPIMEAKDGDIEELTVIGESLYLAADVGLGTEPYVLDLRPGSGFDPLLPARLMDSRPGQTTTDGVHAGEGTRAAGSVTEVQVAGRGGVAADAAAVSLNVTIVRPDAAGFATVFPCGDAVPGASNINYSAGDIAPNAVLSKIGDGGKVCVFTVAGTHLLVDVNGAFS